MFAPPLNGDVSLVGDLICINVSCLPTTDPVFKSNRMLIALLAKQDRRNAQYLTVCVYLRSRDTQTELQYRHVKDVNNP